MNKKGLQKYTLIIIPVLFLIYSAPSALDYVFHFPDEKYYTDSVLQMMDKEDYFTPYKADGSPRFLKPIATYWVLIASYKMFGISPISSRIFFWLAGALLVALTYLLTLSISKNKKTAGIAAFITASNPLVLMSASRSIPDILLTLFLTISAWGFMEIMLQEKPKKKFYWMAYLGAAFAFETKGIPAAAFAGISILFLLFNPWKRINLKKLIHPASMFIAVFIALSWFIIMYVEHGAMYLDSFFADQVGDRVSSKVSLVFKNGLLGILNLLAFLLPWIAITLSNPKHLQKYISGLSTDKKAIFGFIGIWMIMIIIMSGAVFKFYDRYLLPVVPLASIFMASVFTESETRFKNVILKILLSLNITILTISLLYGIFILPDPLLITGILAGSTIVILYLKRFFQSTAKESLIANGILLLYFNAFIFLYPLLMPNPGKQLVNNLYKNMASTEDTIYVYGNIRTASNIRVHSGNRLNVVSMDTIYNLPSEMNHILVVNKKEKDFLNLNNHTLINGSEEWLRVSPDKFPGFLKQSIIKLKQNSTSYYLVKPNKITPKQNLSTHN